MPSPRGSGLRGMVQRRGDAPRALEPARIPVPLGRAPDELRRVQRVVAQMILDRPDPPDGPVELVVAEVLAALGLLYRI